MVNTLLLLLAPVQIPSSYLESKKSILKDEKHTKNSAIKLTNLLTGNDGRIYACSGKDLYAFESFGSLLWTVYLNHDCNVDIPPVADDRGKAHKIIYVSYRFSQSIHILAMIYLIADNKVLEIKISNIGTHKPSVEIFSASNSTIEGSGEIIGLSISTSYSALFLVIKNRGLFAYHLRRQLMWSVGPILYRFGYRQGCKINMMDCYFISAPVVDQCEGTLYISNSEGQVYSLFIRSPNFRWIQDFSSVDNVLIITPGNNGHLYLTFPRRALLIALDVFTGNILWQNEVGPLSKEDCFPVVDSNGWISIGSLDGFLYTFSPTGELRKFLETTALSSVIQASPVLDCSGFALYISQTMMQNKTNQVIGNYSYISAMGPMTVLAFLLAPATGTIYWIGKFPGVVSALFAKTDLMNFQLDEHVLLKFLASSRTGNTLPCHSTGQKLAWTCMQGGPKFISIYTGDERAVIVFVLFQFIILVLLAVVVRFCRIFWGKRKLHDRGLGKFLDKRQSLHKRRKALSKKISQIEQEAANDATANEDPGQLGEVVKAKEGVERKLSASYSLGRDNIACPSPSILPLYDGKRRNHSFNSSRKEFVAVFNTISDESSSSEETRNDDDAYGIENGTCSSEEELEHWRGYLDMDSAMREKNTMEVGSSSGVVKSYEPLDE